MIGSVYVTQIIGRHIMFHLRCKYLLGLLKSHFFLERKYIYHQKESQMWQDLESKWSYTFLVSNLLLGASFTNFSSDISHFYQNTTCLNFGNLHSVICHWNKFCLMWHTLLSSFPQTENGDIKSLAEHCWFKLVLGLDHCRNSWYA